MSKTCPDCQMEIPDYARVCPHCGYRFTSQELTHEHREKSVSGGIGFLVTGGFLAWCYIPAYISESETYQLVISIIAVIFVLAGLYDIFSGIIKRR